MNCYHKMKINAAITESFFCSGTSTDGTLGQFKWCLPEEKVQISELYGNFRPFRLEAKL